MLKNLMLKDTKNIDHYNVDYWRDLVKKQRYLLNGTCLDMLIEADPFFKTKEGIYTWANIRAGRASLAKTRQAALILSKHAPC
jgi:hypothetical protein